MRHTVQLYYSQIKLILRICSKFQDIFEKAIKIPKKRNHLIVNGDGDNQKKREGNPTSVSPLKYRTTYIIVKIFTKHTIKIGQSVVGITIFARDETVWYQAMLEVNIYGLT